MLQLRGASDGFAADTPGSHTRGERGSSTAARRVRGRVGWVTPRLFVETCHEYAKASGERVAAVVVGETEGARPLARGRAQEPTGRDRAATGYRLGSG